MTHDATLATWRAAARPSFDLTSPAHHRSLRLLAEQMLAAEDLSLAAVNAAANSADAPLEFRMAAMLYRSRMQMLSLTAPVHVAVVFAMWGEQHRLHPSSDANPFGEDALRRKIEQLAWVCRGTPARWSLYAVDDGCPHGSGAIAQEIAATYAPAQPVHVLHLDHYLPATDGPLRQLSSVDDSRKAGALIAGSMQAIADGVDAVLYTDADSSVHLGQIGLLVAPYVQDGIRVVLGNRKHPASVLVKDGARWGVGIKSLRHMQRMAGHAIFSRNILDTQAAFKLYDAALLQRIIATPTVFDFSFDTDWIAAFLSMGEDFAQTPFAFIDSPAESATAKQLPMTTWETLLHGLVRALRHHELLHTPFSRAMADVIDEEITDYRDLELIIDHLPDQLVDAGEADYGDPEVMSPVAMRQWIQQRKAMAA
ncbi:MAG: glycosyltransferase [Bacteroidetes bacterium]|jgi:hypothetical protein|nr:glycosyltransferase [Bacteroidota bacterium]